MRRKRQQASDLTVSLFPFLAVLICTMGMLIVMLVLAVKSSSVKAQQARQDQAEDIESQRAVLTDELELEAFRVKEIAKLRPALEKSLEEQKLRRAHLENELQRLVRESKSLQLQFVQMAADDQSAQQSAIAQDQEIADLKALIEARDQELEELRAEVAGRPIMYSIVPTRSVGGTLRRPIYVECTPDSIVLQPTGIRIELDQFTKPVLPGNPLDAALLATREYWNRFDAGSSEGEPYPLIVVRPGGALAYAIARRAMRSWDDEFGYELVEAEKTLNWGKRDNNLQSQLNQAIRIAMQRQTQAVALGNVQWVRGVRSRAGLGGPDQARRGGGSSQESTNRIGNQELFANGSPLGSGIGDFDASQAFSGESGRQPNGRVRERSVSQQAPDSLDSNVDALVSGSFAGGNSSTRPDNRARLDTSIDDSLSRFAANSNNQGARDSKANPLRGSERERESSSKFDGGNSGSSPMQANIGNADGNSGGGNSDPTALASQSGLGNPLAESRGRDWALPTRTPGATPYRRPIRVDCHVDHFMVHSGNKQDSPVKVPIGQTVDSSIDELVNQVWSQIEGWGIAEVGGYWKPVLRLANESRNGAMRADQLARKLRGSGIEIERLWR